ncbi:MAG TPA: type ISP restriction/modification enzyme, partial [Pyrinomonadaceae bacterium]|nr:type ISP restriction/modification enzyme [Pyrinomonadaceae bacterium]
MAKIYYARMDEFWRKKEKYDFLEEKESISNIQWEELHPDVKNNWLTGELKSDFESFLLLGTKEAKRARGTEEVIFKLYSYGVLTARDSWAYAFSLEALRQKIERLVDLYNADLNLWERKGQGVAPSKFLLSQNPQIKWTRRLFKAIENHLSLEIKPESFRKGLYRPFSKRHLYFNKILNEEIYSLPSIFPRQEIEEENHAIWIKVGSEWPMFVLMINIIPDALPQGGSQSFPFYSYDEDGTNRRENITDWALERFRGEYKDSSITKWDIFHYVYAVLHHPV